MIGFIDAYMLARTKLRTKRLRLVTTTVVSSLMFGVLIGAIIVGGGAMKSIDVYTNATNSGHYLVAATFRPPMSIASPTIDTAAMQKILTLHTTYVAERTAAAKKYGVVYDPKTEDLPFFDKNNVMTTTISSDGYVNTASVAYQRYMIAIIRDYKTSNSISPDHLRATAAAYGMTASYSGDVLGSSSVTYLENGVEDYTKDTAAYQPTSYDDMVNSSVLRSNYTLTDDVFAKPYTLTVPANKRDAHAIPVMLSVTEAVKLFGKQHNISQIPKKPAEQIIWMNTVRDALAGQTYTVCYRNDSDRALLQLARQQTAEIAMNASNKEFVKPSLVYDLPSTPCGAVPVVRDVRTTDEKAATTKQQNFDREFGRYSDPMHELITFQIVGLLPPTLGSVPTELNQLVTSLVSVNVDGIALVPRVAYEALPAADQHKVALTPASNEQTSGYEQSALMIDFSSPAAAKKFIKEQGCPIELMNCEPTRPYMLTAYGSNYLMVDEIANASQAPLTFLFSVEMVVATLIIWAMTGRVMADNRRETAVFRALGAKRRDIGAVYLLYSLMVALRIAALALVLGGGIALCIDIWLSRDISRYASVSYGLFNDTLSFHFIDISSPLIWQIVGCIIAVGLIAVIIPLLRNVRRNPIRDMRDE